MKDVYFCMLTNNQSTINPKIPFYTAKSYHSTILVRYEGPGVSRLRHFFCEECIIFCKNGICCIPVNVVGANFFGLAQFFLPDRALARLGQYIGMFACLLACLSPPMKWRSCNCVT